MAYTHIECIATLCAHNITHEFLFILILTNLSNTRNFFHVFLEKNMSAILILFAALVLLLVVISVPTLQHVFNFEFPGYQHFLVSILAATVMLSLLEVIKVFKKKDVFNR